jgi:hypothetical protein
MRLPARQSNAGPMSGSNSMAECAFPPSFDFLFRLSATAAAAEAALRPPSTTPLQPPTEPGLVLPSGRRCGGDRSTQCDTTPSIGRGGVSGPGSATKNRHGIGGGGEMPSPPSQGTVSTTASVPWRFDHSSYGTTVSGSPWLAEGCFRGGSLCALGPQFVDSPPKWSVLGG